MGDLGKPDKAGPVVTPNCFDGCKCSQAAFGINRICMIGLVGHSAVMSKNRGDTGSQIQFLSPSCAGLLVIALFRCNNLATQVANKALAIFAKIVKQAGYPGNIR